MPAKTVKLTIKSFKTKEGATYATAGFFPKPEHLPESCKEGEKIIRKKVLPDEVFEAPEDEAKTYLETGTLEVVL